MDEGDNEHSITHCPERKNSLISAVWRDFVRAFRRYVPTYITLHYQVGTNIQPTEVYAHNKLFTSYDTQVGYTGLHSDTLS